MRYIAHDRTDPALQIHVPGWRRAGVHLEAVSSGAGDGPCGGGRRVEEEQLSAQSGADSCGAYRSRVGVDLRAIEVDPSRDRGCRDHVSLVVDDDERPVVLSVDQVDKALQHGAVGLNGADIGLTPMRPHYSPLYEIRVQCRLDERGHHIGVWHDAFSDALSSHRIGQAVTGGEVNDLEYAVDGSPDRGAVAAL